MNDYKFIPLLEEDLNEASELYETSLKANLKGFVQNIQYHGYLSKMNNDFSSDNGGVYLLKDQNKIIGLGALRNDGNNTVEICKLHVRTEHKGKGLGRKLVEELIEEAKRKKYQKMNLHVTKTQEVAICLYNKLGFKKYHEQVYTISNNGVNEDFDTLLMEKKL